MTRESAETKLKELEEQLYALHHACSVLYTDGQTAAPKNSWKGRGKALAYLGGLEYQAMVSEETGEMLRTIMDCPETDPVTRRRAEVLKEDYDAMHVIPLEEYVAYQELVNEASTVWHDAKERSDFPLFAPYLEKLVVARRRYAAAKHPEMPAYDVLLDEFEKGVGMAELDPFFRTLQTELAPLIREVSKRTQPVPDFLKKTYPVEKQRLFSEKIMALEGIDSLNCTLGETEHPFTDGCNKWDVRITTHYHEDPLSSLYSVIHEGGHALYEMNVADEFQFTCLAGGSTMGLHESQSRFYENLIGRSRAFCGPLLRIFREIFPEETKGVTEEDLYRAVNRAEPSLIRTEADELTYSLHVMIRYELEKRLISGDLAVQDLPGEWNRMYRETLGVCVPDDRSGVLQDSHWSGGGFGYFPSYALGSAYGVQMLRRMESETDVWGPVSRGDLGPVTAWLKEHVHRFGRSKKPGDILAGVMGGPLDASVYTGYLKDKFGNL